MGLDVDMEGSGEEFETQGDDVEEIEPASDGDLSDGPEEVSEHRIGSDSPPAE